jgi:mono/diheme cytochrome c family protein
LLAAVISSMIAGKAWAQAPDSLAKRGELISKQHCSRCHVVDRKKRFGGISSTPSFSLLVNELDDWEDRFASFHNRLPHPSIVRFNGDTDDPVQPSPSTPIVLDHSDIDAVKAFAGTLAKKDR